MDIAHQLATLRAQPPGELLKTANRYLPPAVTLVLLAVVAYLAAQLTWRLVPAQADVAPLPPIGTPTAGGGSAGSGAIDASRIVNRHVFGVAAPPEAKPEVNVSQAPVTTQPLKLTGILYEPSEGGQVRIAQIARSSNQPSRIYRVGDTIEDLSGVRVVEVLEREVLLNVNGRVEKLTFCTGSSPQTRACQSSPGTVASQPRPVTPSTLPGSQPTPATVAVPAQRTSGDPRQLISSNAQRIANILRVSPHNQDGVTGFRVTAGQDRENFEALGFKDNDVVLNINGAPLANPQDGAKILDSLADTNTTTVTVLRDGTQTTITLDTSRIRSILENRE